jgi:hypothetical protein
MLDWIDLELRLAAHTARAERANRDGWLRPRWPARRPAPPAPAQRPRPAAMPALKRLLAR